MICWEVGDGKEEELGDIYQDTQSTVRSVFSKVAKRTYRVATQRANT